MLSWSGNNARELCCIWRSRRLYWQTNCNCIAHFITVATTATPLSSPSSPIHSLSVSTDAPSLWLAHSHSLTHLTHTPRAALHSWKGLRHSYNGNCRCRRPIDRTWTPSSFTVVTGVDVFWIFSELCRRLCCRKKMPQFAKSAETRWQVILFKFPTDWRYMLLLHYVVNKCFKFDNVVWYIVNKGQILYCLKV